MRDDERYLEDAACGRDLGYGGKLCVHPAQVALAHRVFSPSDEELDRSHRLLEAYERSMVEGPCDGRVRGPDDRHPARRAGPRGDRGDRRHEPRGPARERARRRRPPRHQPARAPQRARPRDDPGAGAAAAHRRRRPGHARARDPRRRRALRQRRRPQGARRDERGRALRPQPRDRGDDHLPEPDADPDDRRRRGLRDGRRLRAGAGLRPARAQRGRDHGADGDEDRRLPGRRRHAAAGPHHRPLRRQGPDPHRAAT